MAITLKLNSGGFVRCLTRSDLGLSKKNKIKNKISVATKQLNYTDHKHFFFFFFKSLETPSLGPRSTKAGKRLLERRIKYLFILKWEGGE